MKSFRAGPEIRVLKAGSCAAEACESRQVREEAAVSKLLRVPQGCLAGARTTGIAWGSFSRTGCTVAVSLFVKTHGAQQSKKRGK